MQNTEGSRSYLLFKSVIMEHFHSNFLDHKDPADTCSRYPSSSQLLHRLGSRSLPSQSSIQRHLFHYIESTRVYLYLSFLICKLLSTIHAWHRWPFCQSKLSQLEQKKTFLGYRSGKCLNKIPLFLTLSPKFAKLKI